MILQSIIWWTRKCLNEYKSPTSICYKPTRQDFMLHECPSLSRFVFPLVFIKRLPRRPVVIESVVALVVAVFFDLLEGSLLHQPPFSLVYDPQLVTLWYSKVHFIFFCTPSSCIWKRNLCRVTAHNKFYYRFFRPLETSILQPQRKEENMRDVSTQ